MKKCLAATLMTLLISPGALAWDQEGLRLRGKLIGRYQIRDQEPKYGRWTDEISLHRARFDARWDVVEDLRLQLELEMTGGVKARDVYVRYKFHKAFKLWVGNFKKPFSRLRMTSRWDLLIPRRGIVDDHLVRKTMFGGFGRRDAGVMISGRVGAAIKLRYFLGVFDGDFLNAAFHQDPDDPGEDNTNYRDYVARVQARLFPGVVVGFNYNHKRAGVLLSAGDERRLTFNLLGGDVRISAKGFRLQLEGLWGDNPNAQKGRKALGGHAILSYRIKLNQTMQLVPAFMFEYLDPDDELDGGDAMRLAGALNLLIGDHTRITLSAEGGIDEYAWEIPEYVDPETLELVQKGPIEVPTRILLQVNFVI
jgi:hypothetical protein